MTSRDFCFWLQGYLELNNEADTPKPLTPKQMQTIANHLGLVFKHEIDPSMGGPEHQATLDAIHNLEKKFDTKVKKESSGGLMRC